MKKSMGRVAFFVAMLVMFVHSAFARTQVSALTFPSVESGTRLENFPILVRLSDGNPVGFSYAEFPTASNLAFRVKHVGVYLPFEVDTWNISGESLIWVSVPSFEQTTELEMFLCSDDKANPAPEFVNDAATLWQRAGYIGVWHMNGLDSEGYLVDSSGHNLHAKRDTATGLPAVFASSSPLGGGCVGNMKNGTAQNSGGALVPGARFANIDFAGTMNFSCWLCSYSGGRLIASSADFLQGFCYPFSKSNAGIFIMSAPYDDRSVSPTLNYCIGANYLHDGNNPLVWASGGNAAGVWRYLDLLVRSDGTARGFENGRAWYDNNRPTVTVAPVQNPRTNGLCLGGQTNFQSSFGGYFDEFRIAAHEHTLAWAKTEYAMQTDPNFVVMSATEDSVEEINHSITETGINYAQLNANVNGWANGTFYISISQEGTKVESLTIGGMVASYTFKRLSPNVTYGYEVAFTNNNGVGLETVRGVFVTEEDAGGDIRYKANITIAPHAGSTTLENFPCLVRLSPSRVKDFDFAQCGTEGSNIRFYDAEGSVVPHEIDFWNPEGDAIVWVSLPKYPGQGGQAVELTMEWGGTDESNLPSINSADVWTRANYLGVWHLSKAASDGTYSDSTGNGLSAARQAGAVYPQRDATAFTAEGLSLGGGLSMGGSTSGNGLLVSSALSSSKNLTIPFTFSSWVNHKSPSGRIITTGASYNAPNITAGVSSSSSTIFNVNVMGQNSSYFTGPVSGSYRDVWCFVAGVFNGTRSRAYFNGAETRNSPGTANMPLSYQLSSGIGIGVLTGRSEAFGGSIDEARIRNVESSADWLAAEYVSVTNDVAEFSNVSVVTNNLMPVVENVSFKSFGQTGVTIGWTVKRAGEEADTVDVICEYGLDPENLDWSKVVLGDTIGTQSVNWEKCLLPARTYWFRLRVRSGLYEVLTPLYPVATGVGSYVVDPAQPVISVLSEVTGVDRISISGALYLGNGLYEGSQVTAMCGGVAYTGVVADGGTWEIVIDDLDENYTVSYVISVVTAEGKHDSLPSRMSTTRARSTIAYVWKAKEPSAWTDRAAWATSPDIGPSYPINNVMSATFPAECCATATVSGAIDVYRVEFNNPSCLKLVGVGTGASLSFTPLVRTEVFREGSNVIIDNLRFFSMDAANGNAYNVVVGDGSTIELVNGSQWLSVEGLKITSSSIRIADSSMAGGRDSNGNKGIIAFADVDLTIENGRLSAFRSFDSAAVEGVGGTRITLRGSSSTLRFNAPLNGVSEGDARFWSNYADTTIAFDLTGESLTEMPIECLPQSNGSNDAMGAGAGMGRIVLTVPRTAGIANLSNACEIQVVSWPDGIDTNRVVFGAVGRRGDSFAYTWPENAEPESLPTGIVYRHVSRQGIVIFVK